MPFAQFKGTGDSTTVQFQIPFPYVKKDHIIVSLDQVQNTNFTYINDTTIVFTPLSSSSYCYARNIWSSKNRGRNNY